MEPGPAVLPLLSEPHDTLRFGLTALKEGLPPAAHPAQAAALQSGGQREAARRDIQRQTFGAAFVARGDIERQVLSKIRRLPGLSSSMAGLDSYTGALDEFGFEDYLGDPAVAEEGPQLGLHHAMEIRLGLSKGPQQATPSQHPF